MKFYTVTAEIEYVIAVENDGDEQLVAEDAWRDVKYEADPDIWVSPREITKLSELPSGWDGMCIPYGDTDGNTRLEDLLKDE